MSVTDKLLKVFLVDKQLRGLQSRLRAAEKFLSDQTGSLQQIESKKAALETQLRQLTAATSERQGEMARLDEKLKTVKERMDAAQTNKEYKAFLTEMNGFKEARDKVETEALEQMGKIDELKKQLAEMTTQRDDRQKVAKVADDDRSKRAAEIKDRLDELTKERATLAAEIPKEPLKTFELLIRARGDDAMAQIEIQDRKRHEYNCGSCMMSIPVETISSVLGSGRLTTCVSCGCILYVTEADAKSLQEPAGGKGKSRSSSAG
ncbi:MAG: hypothetical protein IT435_07740 [Phycisphaerales bacterium]|nr:hypothetical protein [Phycisphaerales bacterium]